MIKRKRIAPLLFLPCLLVYACTGINRPALGIFTGKTETGKEVLFSYDFLCAVSIGDKQYVLPEDSVIGRFTGHDSLLHITIRGLETGHMILTIPHPFKCPCIIPVSYNKLSGGMAAAYDTHLQPTVILYNYPQHGIAFNNTEEAMHDDTRTANAIEITGIQQTNKNTATSEVEYTVNGNIHTTVFEKPRELPDTEYKRAYKVRGSFSIRFIMGPAIL